MLIFEKGSQRYILDSKTGKPVKFDPWLHDRKNKAGWAQADIGAAPEEAGDPSGDRQTD